MTSQQDSKLPEGFRILKNELDEHWLQYYKPASSLLWGLITTKGKWVDVEIGYPFGADGTSTKWIVPLFASPQEAIEWLEARQQRQNERKKRAQMKSQVEIVQEGTSQ